MRWGGKYVDFIKAKSTSPLVEHETAQNILNATKEMTLAEQQFIYAALSEIYLDDFYQNTHAAIATELELLDTGELGRDNQIDVMAQFINDQTGYPFDDSFVLAEYFADGFDHDFGDSTFVARVQQIDFFAGMATTEVIELLVDPLRALYSPGQDNGVTRADRINSVLEAFFRSIINQPERLSGITAGLHLPGDRAQRRTNQLASARDDAADPASESGATPSTALAGQQYAQLAAIARV